MLFNSRVLSLLLGGGVAFLLFIFLQLTQQLPMETVFISSLLSMVAASLLVYLAIEFFIFKQINEIYFLLENIKKGRYNIGFKIPKHANANPLVKIKSEIAAFAHQKQAEIEELRKLETFRREFLADVSHELKTPIFAAQGFVHTLIDGAINDLDVRDRFLTKAANSLEGLNVLVKDLITISQLEIGEIKMQYNNFDLHKMTEDIFEQLDEHAKKKGVKLKFHKHSPRSCYVHADKNRMYQVLTNLIVNAIKYGNEKGNIVISFTIESESVYVSVKDDGPGMEQQHLQRIFERFYRIDRSRSRDEGGTGLGLAIVKHILEAHNSKIFVSSKLGRGTIFSFKISKGKVINEKG